MKIVYLHQYFYTANMVGVAGARSYEFARRLVEMGHEVQMVTSATNPPDDASTGWYETVEEGINVNWLPIPYSNKMAFSKRLIAFAKFAWGSAWKAARIKSDVIYATSGPLTIALPALFAAVVTRRPLIFEVRDLWPEGAIQLGVLKNPVAIFFARMLERAAYGYSKHIVALSPGMKEGVVAAGVPAEKVSVIPNACDLELFHPSVDGTELRQKFDLDGKFALSYFGTMGLANGLGYVLDAAKVLKERGNTDIVFILHGDGMQRQDLEKRAKDEGLENVLFSDPVPDKSYVAQLAAAVDVCMTIYNNVPVLATCSPNKLFDTFAAGRPGLTNMPGALQKLIEEHECGVYVDPSSPEDFADKVSEFSKLPAEKINQLRQNSRALGERMFSRENLARNMRGVMESVAQNGNARGIRIENEWV